MKNREKRISPITGIIRTKKKLWPDLNKTYDVW